MKTIKISILFIFCMTLTISSFSFAEEADEVQMGEELTQEEFAVELVKSMDMQGWLPTAALASDCVELFERLGIMPLQGWNKKALLTQEEYLVILAKTQGKERMLYDRAVAVEKKNIEVIQKKWEEAHKKQGQWVALSELLNDRQYFPGGPPKSPFGIQYRDKNKDQKVDPLFLPVVGLMKLRDMLSSR